MQLLSAAALFGAIGGLFYLLRRANWVRLEWNAPKGPGKTLAVQERVAIGPQHSLCVVKFGGGSYLIGTHPSGCVVLAEDRPPQGQTAPCCKGAAS